MPRIRHAVHVEQVQGNIKSITSDLSSRVMQLCETLIKERLDRAQGIEAATCKRERDKSRASFARIAPRVVTLLSVVLHHDILFTRCTTTERNCRAPISLSLSLSLSLESYFGR